MNTGMNILIVEPDKASEKLYKKMLSYRKETNVVLSKRESVEKMIQETVENNINVVLMEPRLPSIDSKAFVTLLKKTAPSTKIIIATATPKEYVKNFPEFDEYLEKPFSTLDFMLKIERVSGLGES